MKGWMTTRTHFEKEVKGNSEMAYCKKRAKSLSTPMAADANVDTLYNTNAEFIWTTGTQKIVFISC